jgi:hypothetical protein
VLGKYLVQNQNEGCISCLQHLSECQMVACGQIGGQDVARSKFVRES